jgi:hypothetical protein
MLQIDHVYEFLYQKLFKDFDFYHLFNGVSGGENISASDISVFTPSPCTTKKIFFYDQEPLIGELSEPYLNVFTWTNNYAVDEIVLKNKNNNLPYGINPVNEDTMSILLADYNRIYKQGILVTSEFSNDVDNCLNVNNLKSLYYFFHGFAALDWYRGFYALNYSKQIIKEYKYDYITFNRLVSNDRSYRCYFISKLAEELLLEHGQVSFGLATEQASWQEEIADVNTKLSTKAVNHIKLHLPSTSLVIDNERVLGSASADIPRCANDSFWHVVTETVFYYDKLHLTEKTFKPIVMKQPFMLLGAVGNLAYLKSYGFKTFEGIIDESYDTIVDNDQRIEAVVRQIAWYCALTAEEKQQVIEAIAPIVEYNFHHFYGEFKHIITRELLDNCKVLFKEIGYDDNAIAYDDIHHVLTN